MALTSWAASAQFWSTDAHLQAVLTHFSGGALWAHRDVPPLRYAYKEAQCTECCGCKTLVWKTRLLLLPTYQATKVTEPGSWQVLFSGFTITGVSKSCASTVTTGLALQGRKAKAEHVEKEQETIEERKKNIQLLWMLITRGTTESVSHTSCISAYRKQSNSCWEVHAQCPH